MSINLRTRQGWDDLKHQLDARADEVLRRLGLPEPRKHGWTVIDDPRGDGRDCFGLCLRGDGLSWKKFNGDAGGRLLELIAYVNGWYERDRRGASEAANWAIDALGLGRISADQLARDRANAQARQAQARADDAEALRRRQGRAYHIFVREAVPILGPRGEGTGAEIYLRDARGIDLRAEPFRGPRNGLIAPASLRFIARHRYIHRDRKGRKYRETFHPALLACCVDGNMKIRAIHQTYLKDDFSDKVDLPPAPDGAPQKPRKIWPDYQGCVIPLWRGEGHFSPREAEENGLLQTFVFTEGVEDGLSAVLAGPQFRVWAMLSLSNMVNVAQRLPACCDSAIIHRQNDWQKPQAVAAFDAGMAAFRAAGRAVSEVAATTGKDLNDTLRGAA